MKATKTLLTLVLGLLIFLIFGTALVIAATVDGDLGIPDGDGKGGLSTKVPKAFRPWLLKASAACNHKELTPGLMAAQLYQESKFSTDRDTVSHAGAEGPAQFMPGTWATWGRDSDGNGTADPYDVGDAVTAQGRYMCDMLGDAKQSGYGEDPRKLALAGYNAGWGKVQEHRGVPPISETQTYVRNIMSTIGDFSSVGIDVDGNTQNANALRKASTQLGVPYSWGGGTPAGPGYGFCDGTNGYDRQTGACSASQTKGFDCSSLVQYAYWPNARLPRVAEAQYNATSDQPVSRNELRQGDLLFWSNGTGIYHVAFYAGDGKVLHAPRTGKNVEVVPIARAMPPGDYLGATRP